MRCRERASARGASDGAVAGPQRLQIANHASFRRPQDTYILNSLSQRQAALKSSDQKSSRFVWAYVATYQPAVLPFTQSGGHSVVPFVENLSESLPESLVQRRHLLSQVIQWTAAMQL